ncbi:DNA methyltransferase [Metasolibacillus sp.]|uniref:DNA-methyltransferase n=1 Tax=Metasolibacillus sp. TaxID=2703680 RepID=UPI0025D77810|nr:DNA methyltransferase [Metasolibacillus sp.]MCT6922827.1 site-specific DNA-methyltransferase [Metasolibacillus sp.]MCT6938834.1 site-specific DNA-methyltransferase [Metasolibacillus sp.]
MEIKKNTIYNMDCLEGMKHIPDKSIDMILCDLPYGTTNCAWDSIIPFDLLWAEYERIIKDNGAIVLTASQPFTSKLVMSNPKLFRYEWIWKKGKHTTGFQNANRMPLKNHEAVLVFYKKLPTYNPQGVQHIKPVLIKNSPKMKVLGDRNVTLSKPHVVKKKNFPKSVIDFPRDSKTFHPTQKPLSLWKYLMLTYTNEGDTVLDTCAGGLTTAVAGDDTKRNWICFEIETPFCLQGKDRVNENRLILGLPPVEIYPNI